MDADDMNRHIRESFDGTVVVHSPGTTHYIYDPDRDLPPERQVPYATVVTGDDNDTVSRLDEPGAYRVNIGLTKQTYASWLGPAPVDRDADGVLRTGYDYALRDAVLPHPHYASLHFVCVVNPGAATTQTVLAMLAEAHAFAARKHANHRARQRPS